MLSISLPQLAVSAKLLCLLMVVICRAVPSMAHSGCQLYSERSNKYVRISESGQVYAAEPSNADNYSVENFTMVSIDFTSLSIYSEATRKLICFNKHWRLVGMPVKKNRREQARCQFREDITEGGFSTFRSVANEAHYLAFNARGKPLKLHPTKGYCQKCIYISKNCGFRDKINHHHERLSQGNPPSSAFNPYSNERLRRGPVSKRTSGLASGLTSGPASELISGPPRPHRRRHNSNWRTRK